MDFRMSITFLALLPQTAEVSLEGKEFSVGWGEGESTINEHQVVQH